MLKILNSKIVFKMIMLKQKVKKSYSFWYAVKII